MTVDPPDEIEFDDTVAEAVDSLREAHPDADRLEGEPTLESLSAVLSDAGTETAVRNDVARVLSMLAERFPGELARIVPTLVDRLDDEAVRTPLLRTLGYVSKADPDAVRHAVDSLVTLLDADDPAVVRNATWVLSNVAAGDSDAVAAAFPRIATLLSHEDEEVQRRAARALSSAPESLVAADRSILERLLELLESPSLYRTVGRTLVSTAPAYEDRLVDELFERLESGRPAVREHAAWTLVPLADEHPDLVRPRWAALVEIVRDDDDYQVRNSAAAALAAVATDRPEDELLSALIGLLDHDDMYVRRYGCLALGDVAVARGNGAALRALDEARDDAVRLVSREAEQLLANAARKHPDSVSGIADDLVDASDNGS